MKLIPLALLLLLSVNVATAAQIGVNGGAMWASGTYRSISDDAEFRTLAANGMKRYRTTVPLAADTDPWVATRFATVLASANRYGVKLEPVLALPLMWGDKTDAGRYPAGDAAAIYAQGYNRTLSFVSQFASQVNDWELGNELNLTVQDASGAPLFGRGWTADEFAAYPSMTDYANLLRGMSDAIDQINASQGLNLRRIVGTTSTMFGYIDFMRSRGVKVDVIGYHYYEHTGVDPTNYWGGVRPPFNLFTKLGSYGVPAAVNEMNCGEIYDASFANTATSPSMATCNSNLRAMLDTFGRQPAIEWIDAYELLDEAEKAAPGNRFGLMFQLDAPKPLLATIAAAAGVPPSVTFPDTLVVIANRQPMHLAPTVVGPATDLRCTGVLLPVGLTINSSTCEISGTPIYTTVPTYVTSTIIVSATNQVDVVSFEIN